MKLPAFGVQQSSAVLKDKAVMEDRADGAQSVSESCVINQSLLLINMTLEVSSGHGAH